MLSTSWSTFYSQAVQLIRDTKTNFKTILTTPKLEKRFVLMAKIIAKNSFSFKYKTKT